MLAVIAAAFLLTPTCGQVDPITNSAAWITPRGRMQVATYNGDEVQWNRPVPRFIHKMVTTRKGTAIRTGCSL